MGDIYKLHCVHVEGIFDLRKKFLPSKRTVILLSYYFLTYLFLKIHFQDPQNCIATEHLSSLFSEWKYLFEH